LLTLGGEEGKGRVGHHESKKSLIAEEKAVKTVNDEEQGGGALANGLQLLAVRNKPKSSRKLGMGANRKKTEGRQGNAQEGIRRLRFQEARGEPEKSENWDYGWSKNKGLSPVGGGF